MGKALVSIYRLVSCMIDDMDDNDMNDNGAPSTGRQLHSLAIYSHIDPDQGFYYRPNVRIYAREICLKPSKIAVSNEHTSKKNS